MSLLLDALRRAEQEKLAKGEPAVAPAQLAPAPAPPPAAASAPVAANSLLELQPIASLQPAAPARAENPAHAAQVLFSAKNPREKAASNRGMVWATVGAILIMVIAAGAYVWYSLHMLTPRLVAAASPPRPPSAPTAAPASGTIASNSNNSAGIESPPVDPRSAAVEAIPGAPAAPAAAAVQPPRAPSARPIDDLVAQVLKEGPAAEPPLRLARTSDRPRIPVEIANGYEALTRGDLGAARRAYGAALAADAGNLDALLGMATLEARSGRPAEAAAGYRRALYKDPRNATALAGLASLADTSRPDALESQLRDEVSRYPQSAELHAALGSFYSSQSRWNEAQAEFFEAHRLDPGTADILYNLAVSLDHLGQSRLAADFYRQALEAARGRATQFDPAPVARRLAELRP